MHLRRLLVPALALVAVGAAAQPVDPLREHLERAESFQLAGDLDRTEAEYLQQVLPRALRRLGNLSGVEGQLDESLELLEAGTALDPSDVDLRVDFAVALLRKREFARAAGAAHDATTVAPRHGRALSVLGRARLLLGDAAGAAEPLRRALAEEPRFETAYALALSNLLLKRTGAARALFDQMLGSRRSADMLVLVGRAYLAAGLRSEASRYFAEALEQNRGDARAEHYLRLVHAGPGVPVETPDAVILEMLPAASGADAARRAEMRAQLEQVLATSWHNLTVIYTRQGRPEQAADAARRSARWSRRAADATRVGTTDSPAALESLGLARARDGRHDEAEALLRRAVTLDPALGDAWLTLARLYLRSGDLARAEHALGRVPAALQGAAAPVWLHFQIAAGGSQEWRPLLTSAAERADAETAAALIDLLSDRSLFEEAERFLANVKPVQALAPEVRLSTARMRMRQGDLARAETLLRDVLAADPASTAALRLLAGVATARNEHEHATDLLIRARDAATPTPEVLRELARAAARSGRIEEALAAARQLTSLAPDDADARYLLAITLLQNQEWDAAIRTLDSTPAAAAGDPRWGAAVGMAHYGKRDHEAARRAFEAVVALDPAHAEARFHLGLIAREQGRTSDAVTELQRAVTIAPDHAAAHMELGALYLLQGDMARARAALERAVALDPDAPGPHYQLGLMYSRLGDTERARREMDLFQQLRERALAGRSRPVVQERRQKGGP